MLESGSAFRAVSPPAVPPMRFAFSHQAPGTEQRQDRATDSTRMAAWSLAQVLYYQEGNASALKCRNMLMQYQRTKPYHEGDAYSNIPY